MLNPRSQLLGGLKKATIEMILLNPKMTQTAMAEKLDITSRAVKKSIKELNEKGILQRVGSARSGYWEVKDN